LHYGVERKVICGKEPKKLKDILLTFIEARMISKPTITQKELQKDILKMLNLNISRQCVATGIRKLNFSRKRLSKRGITNKQIHAERLEVFSKMYKLAKANNIPIVAIDEVGFDQRTVPLYGYSIKGQKAISECLSMKRKRTTMIMAIDNEGNYKYTFKTNGVNTEVFDGFIKSLPFREGTHLLMDNASIHKTKHIQNILESKKLISMFICPYSPDLNPIENVFSVIKNSFRKKLLETDDDYESIIEEILENINHKTLFNKCFKHMETFLNFESI
jgi:transposase